MPVKVLLLFTHIDFFVFTFFFNRCFFSLFVFVVCSAILESSEDEVGMEECNVVRMEGKKVNAVNIKRSKDNASGMVVHTDNNSASVGSRINTGIGEFVVHTNFCYVDPIFLIGVNIFMLCCNCSKYR